MKTFKRFINETDKDTNSLRMVSLTNQKKNLDNVIKQTRKQQTLQKAYKMISDVNRAPSTKKVTKKNVK